jgi:putative hemolysin
VAEHDLDHVLGIVRAGELLVSCTRGETFDLRQNLHKAVFIPATASAAQALDLFRRARLHTLLVVDEYGSVEGLVTPTDILEFIVGQLPVSEPAEDLEIVQREDGSWLVDGLVRLLDLAHVLPGDNPFYRDFPGFHTLNGFILQTLSHIPTAGEHFTWTGYRFEVVDMDGRRVDKVLISLVDEEGEEPPATVAGHGEGV